MEMVPLLLEQCGVSDWPSPLTIRPTFSNLSCHCLCSFAKSGTPFLFGFCSRPLFVLDEWLVLIGILLEPKIYSNEVFYSNAVNTFWVAIFPWNDITRVTHVCTFTQCSTRPSSCPIETVQSMTNGHFYPNCVHGNLLLHMQIRICHSGYTHSKWPQSNGFI